MKAIMVDDETLERLKRWNAGALALTVEARDGLLSELADVVPLEIREDGGGSALEVAREHQEAIGKVAAELIEAGVPVPGTGRVYPAAVIEQAHAAREELDRLRRRPDDDGEPQVTVRQADVEYLLANVAGDDGEIKLSEATLDELETFTRVKRALYEATS